MRVITGSARGRRLTTLRGDDITRPTAESVKEALFSIIQFDIEGKKVLDLFAGSGQLGIEALSRGAAHCVFVENNKSAAQVVRENTQRCGFSDRSRIFEGDGVSFLARPAEYGIVFLDPPYNKGLIERCLPFLDGAVSAGGLAVCETSKDDTLPEKFGGFSLVRERLYGKTKITIYRKD